MDPNLTWPLAHNVIRRNDKANTFGLVRHKADGSVKPHQGWDLEAPIGTPCFAICDGKIDMVYNSVDYGDVIVLAFPFEGRKLYAAYAHLSSVDVTPGQAVARKQQIGRTGDSGNARGMTGRDLHLHFEIRTLPRPGVGLGGRMSPLDVFGEIPLNAPVDA
ncbi:MAG TPA: M23 family metallopeptidase [Allosphingosinicella sp.]|jgi:murein DD-endopeptidase MepM/ murein hydrolase activator NlpD